MIPAAVPLASLAIGFCGPYSASTVLDHQNLKTAAISLHDLLVDVDREAVSVFEDIANQSPLEKFRLRTLPIRKMKIL